MKNEIIKAVLFIAIPMGLVQIVYRLIDNKFGKTKVFFDKHPVLKKNRNLIRAISTLAVIFVIGVIYMILSQFYDVPREVFYIAVGALAGFINGITISIAYMDYK